MRLTRFLSRGVAAAVAALVAVGGIAAADEILYDADTITAGTQTTSTLTGVRGGTASALVSFQLACTGKSHVDIGQTVTLARHEAKLDGTAVATSVISASASTIGAVPTAWPVDITGGGSTNCPAGLAAIEDNGNSTVSVSIPSDAALGSHTVSVTYRPTLSPTGGSDANAINGNATVTFTLLVIPRAVSSLSAVTDGTNEIDLTWNRSADHADISSYVIERKMGTTGTYAVIDSAVPASGTAPTQTYSDAGLSEATTYCYRVTSRVTIDSTHFDSAVSDEDCATTDAAATNTAPTVTIANKPASSVEGNTVGGANVSWGPVTVTDDNDTNMSASCSDGTNTLTSPAYFPLGGPYTVTCSATDTGGLAGSDAFTFSVVDTTPPTLSNVPANIQETATSAGGAVATYTDPTASDIVDDDVTVTCVPTSGSTFAPGTTTVTCTATDDSSNDATATFTVTVTFDFQGFFQPIDGNMRNGMKSGATAPMKFRIGNGNGGFLSDLSIVRQVQSGVYACSATSPAEDNLEEYATGGTSLRYDSAGQQFIYNWQSPKNKAGSCYRVNIVLTDGTPHYADFILK